MYKPCEIYYNQYIYNEPSYLKLLFNPLEIGVAYLLPENIKKP